MRRTALTLIGAGVVALTGQVASAADMPARPVYKAAPMVAAAPSWTGCYLGVHGGGGWGRQNQPVADVDFDLDGYLVGGQVGCDWQWGGPWVVGIVGDFAGANISGDLRREDFGPFSYELTVNHRINALATIRGRLGVTGWGPDNLFYVTGGWAWAKAERGDLYNGPGADGTPSDKQSYSGWTVGGGWEHMLARNWSLFGEYLYVRLGSATYNLPIATPFEGPEYEVTIKPLHLVKFGISYRFGDWGKGPVAGKGPVVGKY